MVVDGGEGLAIRTGILVGFVRQSTLVVSVFLVVLNGCVPYSLLRDAAVLQDVAQGGSNSNSEIKIRISELKDREVRILSQSGELLEGTILEIGEHTFWVQTRGKILEQVDFDEVLDVKRIDQGFSKSAMAVLIAGIAAFVTVTAILFAPY